MAACGPPGQRPTPFPGSRAPAPYSPAERAELAALAAAQRGAARRSSALALVVFGIGAGLRPGELVALRGDDVIRHGRQVVVHVGGPAARLVPVTPDYGGRAWELARRAGSGFVFRPGPAGRGYKNFVSNVTRGLTADPAAPRQRFPDHVRTAQGLSASSGRRSAIATASLIRPGGTPACSPFQRIHSGSRDRAPAAASLSRQLVI